MNTQQRLFPDGVGPSHHNAPETSHQAALTNTPRRLSQQKRVLLAIYRNYSVHGGLTDDEIARETGLVGNSVRPRRGELFKLGYIQDMGFKRSSWMGNPAVVWGLTGEGALVARELDR